MWIALLEYIVGQRIFHWKSGSRSKLVKCSLGYYFHQFANSPSIKFLIDLVNYLDHKGRPNTLMFLTHNCIIMLLYITVQNSFLFSGLTQGSTAATIHMDERRRWGLGWAGRWWPLMVKSWQALHETALWMNLMKLKVRISQLNWAYTGKIPRGLSDRQEPEFPSIFIYFHFSPTAQWESASIGFV